MFENAYEFNPVNIDKDVDITDAFNKAELDGQTQKEMFEKIKSYGYFSWSYAEKQDRPIGDIIQDILKIKAEKLSIKRKTQTIYNHHELWDTSKVIRVEQILKDSLWQLLRKYTTHFYILNKDFENKFISIRSDHSIRVTFKELIEILYNSRETHMLEEAKIQFEKHCEDQGIKRKNDI